MTPTPPEQARAACCLRPILFSAPMVRAILASRKTVTRRIVGSRPLPELESLPPTYCGAWVEWRKIISDSPTLPVSVYSRFRCRYGAAGDRLWVRETFQTLTGNGHRTVYRADGEPVTGNGESVIGMRWKPSIFMRRAESRITLDVVSVRAERLHDLDDDEAMREGIMFADDAKRESSSPRDAFRRLWDSINGKRAPWSTNPWVWRVEFTRQRP